MPRTGKTPIIKTIVKHTPPPKRRKTITVVHAGGGQQNNVFGASATAVQTGSGQQNNVFGASATTGYSCLKGRSIKINDDGSITIKGPSLIVNKDSIASTYTDQELTVVVQGGKETVIPAPAGTVKVVHGVIYRNEKLYI